MPSEQERGLTSHSGRETSHTISLNECQALRHLRAAGWSRGELKMVFEIGTNGLSRHLDGECEHPDIAAPKSEKMPTKRELRAYRYVEGLTQYEAAQEFGVAPNTWAAWENDTKEARPDHARKLRALVDSVDTDIDPPKSWDYGSPGRPEEYDKHDVLESLKKTATQVSGKLTKRKYRENSSDDMPSSATAYKYYDTWAEALDAAGVEIV